MIRPFTIHRTVVYREVIFNILATLTLVILVSDILIGSKDDPSGLDRIDGIILISYFALFLYYAFKRAAIQLKPVAKIKQQQKLGLIILQVIAGSIALYIGGKFIVDGAVEIAAKLGTSETLIGTTIVALGTSLPELAATIMAVKKKQIDAAVGNVFGSNLFNILWVLGIGTFLVPIQISQETMFDVYIALVISIILFATMIIGKVKHQIGKTEARIMLFLYVLYLFIASFNGFSVI